MIAISNNDGAGPSQVVSGPAGGRAITMNGNQIDSRDLFSSEREIVITHGDDRYRLRLTSQNKLILTK